MKHKSFARFYEIYALLFVFMWPWLIVGAVGLLFGYRDLVETKWTGYLFFAYAIVILMFFFRRGWMASLQSKFPNIDLYAIRTMLGGLVLFAVVTTVETVLGGGIDNKLADNISMVSALTGLALIAVAMIGTLIQAFVGSVRELMHRKDK